MSDERPPSTRKDVFLTFLIAILLIPFTNMVNAKICSIVWSKLLAPQYGAGPTIQSWFGIGCLVSLLTIALKTQTAEDLKATRERPFHTLLSNAFELLLMHGGLLVAALLSVFLWGWS